MFIADFHIHSRHSRATSRESVPEMLALWAQRKGIGVVGTGDFTHPGWRQELKAKLVPAEDGLYTLRADLYRREQIPGAQFIPRFIISGEISSIYKKNGRVRKIHNLIILPGLEEAEAISRRLETIGNLRADGRPILGLDCKDLLEIVLEISPKAIFIPAHIWTPHFSLYGAYSGFNDLEECFEELTEYIYAVETGLSSDPPMNWRLSALDNFTLVSNSDAHSPANLGREANIFDTELSYRGILEALKNRQSKEFRGTIEFFPEEGKYHYDGHRACQVCFKPAETVAAEGRCPVCGGRITVGVLHRVEVLADREEGFVPAAARDFERLIPLQEVIASCAASSPASRKVKEKYEALLQNLGPELFILREAPLEEIALVAGELLAEGIRRLRSGQVEIQPGYDGAYGKIKILDKSEMAWLSGQLSLSSGVEIAGAEESRRLKKRSILRAAKKDAAGEVYAPADEEKFPLTFPPRTPPKKNIQEKAELPRLCQLLNGLNKEQREAVSSLRPAIAVIAGPGTGKTKTLVTRIIYLIEKCAVHPSRITAVTFTNKAAREIYLRLKEHFGKRQKTALVTIGTFHSICLRFLAEHRGGDNLTIIDEYNALAIMEEILKELKVNISPREALRRISLLKNSARLLEKRKELSSPLSSHQKNLFPHDPSLTHIFDLYSSRLKDYGVMDYDDILLEGLRCHQDARGITTESTANPFSHLLVDEFQDINEIQYRLIKEWGKKSEGIFIIGDPDQSIYGFRGADFRYFERFKEDFPDLHLIRLTRNYRSTPEIINCARRALLGETAENSGFDLQATKENGPRVRLINTGDEFGEALFVAKEINRMVGGIDMLDTQILTASSLRREKAAGLHYRSFAEIAVLYRTNRQAEILEHCFLKEGIPYVVAGRDDFLAAEPVREALAFFKFLLNPADLFSLRICLKARVLPSAGLPQKILENYAGGEKGIFSLEKIAKETFLPPEKKKRLEEFIAMLNKYELLLKQNTSPRVLLDSWIKDNELKGEKSLELLLNTAFMAEEMASFLQNLVLGQESDVIRSGKRRYSPQAVSLMTIHAAKGLEFPVVFICGVNEGLIPLKSSDTAIHTDPEEERRLFYVGMTRAQEELILISSSSPSPFIAGIPAELLVMEKEYEGKAAPLYRQATLFEL